MNKKNSEDNLEDLFKNFFHDAQKVNRKEGWNEPSEADWLKIQEGLPVEKKPRRRLFYWWWLAAAASFLLLFSVFHWCNYNQKIKDLSNQLAENDHLIKNMQADLAALSKKETTVDTTTTIITPVIRLSDEQATKETTVFNHVNAAQNSLKQKIIATTSDQVTLEEVVANDVTSKSNTPQLSLNKTRQPLKNQAIKKHVLLEEVSTIPKLPPFLNIKNRTLAAINPPTTPIAKKKNKWSIGIDYSPVWLSVKKSGFRFGQPDFLAEREIQETAYTTGLQIGRSIGNNWYVESGIRYTSVNNLIQNNRTIPYRILQERLNIDGDYESTLNLQVGTSGGAVDTEVSLSRSAATSVDIEENLQFNFSFSNSLAYLDIPIMLRKEWTIGRFGISAKAGFVNRFLLKSSYEVQNIGLEDSRFEPIATRFSDQSTNATKTYSAQYALGLGLSYRINDKWQFYLDPTFTQNMQPIVSFGPANITAQNKMVHVGLRYAL